MSPVDALLSQIAKEIKLGEHVDGRALLLYLEVTKLRELLEVHRRYRQSANAAFVEFHRMMSEAMPPAGSTWETVTEHLELLIERLSHDDSTG